MARAASTFGVGNRHEGLQGPVHADDPWQARRNPSASREEIERQTLEYMATMPAWRDHPRVTSRAG
jgi:hypothetical protein